MLERWDGTVLNPELFGWESIKIGSSSVRNISLKHKESLSLQFKRTDSSTIFFHGSSFIENTSHGHARWAALGVR